MDDLRTLRAGPHDGRSPGHECPAADRFGGGRGAKKTRNEGGSHDLIDNKGPILGTHDVNDNKAVRLAMPRC